MNISNLNNDTIVKNYKELCLLLDMKSTSGKSKTLQLQELERFIKYHKEGNKFIVDEVYQTPLQKIDNRGVDSLYHEDIEKLLIHAISEGHDKDYNNIHMSLNGLLLKLFMINNNYTTGKNNMNKLSIYTEIPINIIWDFYNNTQSKLKDVLFRALNKMSSRCLINWELRTTICTIHNNYRYATDEERQIIVDAELKVLKILNRTNEVKDKRDVLLKGLWKTWSSELFEILSKQGIKYSFNSIDIKASKDFKDTLIETTKYNEIRSNLNNNVSLSCIKTSERANIRALESTIDYYSTTKQKTRAYKDYVVDTMKIVDLCINSNCKITLKDEIEELEADNIFTLYDAKKKDDEILTQQFLDLLL